MFLGVILFSLLTFEGQIWAINCNALLGSKSKLTQSIEVEPTVNELTYVIANEGPVELISKPSTDYPGLTSISRKDSNQSTNTIKYMGSNEINETLVKILSRYYTSHTVNERLLPNAIRDAKLVNESGTQHLLSSEKVRDINFPKVIPLKSHHEDSHVVRMEEKATIKSEHSYTEQQEALDLPNTTVKEGSMSYKFEQHGQSSKERTHYVGRRIEGITKYEFEGQAPKDIQVYSKNRYGEEGQLTAMTIVIKSSEKTLRLRIPKSEFLSTNVNQLIIDTLSKELRIETNKISHKSHLLRLRTVLKIGVGDLDIVRQQKKKLEIIGRLFLDVEVNLKNSEGLENIAVQNGYKPSDQTNVLLQYDEIGFNVQRMFLKKDIDNQVTSLSSKIKLESKSQNIESMNLLLEDIGNFIPQLLPE